MSTMGTRVSRRRRRRLCRAQCGLRENCRGCEMTIAYINRIGTAVPDHDVHETFIRFADQLLLDRKSRLLFKRMVQRAEIAHRYSTLEPDAALTVTAGREGLYPPGRFAGTAA